MTVRTPRKAPDETRRRSLGYYNDLMSLVLIKFDQLDGSGERLSSKEKVERVTTLVEQALRIRRELVAFVRSSRSIRKQTMNAQAVRMLAEWRVEIRDLNVAGFAAAKRILLEGLHADSFD